MAPTLTAGLLERIFKQPIKDFQVQAGCKEGENVGGSVHTIVATTKSGEKITAFFKTFPAKDNPHYQRIKESQIFRIEADVYSKLVPAIQNLIKACNNSTYCLPLPKLYASFHNDEDDYLCLEDVRPEGYKMPNVFIGLTYPECCLAIQELARFHAFTHALIRVQGEKIFAPSGQFNRLFSRFDGPDIQMWFNLLENSVRVAVEVLKTVNPKLSEQLNGEIPPGTAAGIWKQIVDRTDDTLFPCIVHGDFWCNNFLIKYDNKINGQDVSEQNPEQIKFVDFQHTRRGNIFEDLMYFLLTSTTPEFRQKYLHRVLSDYYAAFKNALDWIQCPLPICFSQGYLMDHFCRLTRPALVHMCFAIPLQLGNPTRVYAQMKEADEAVDRNGTPPEGHSENGTNQDSEKVGFDPDLEAKKFAAGLHAMFASSQFAMQRLESLVKEILSYNN